MTRNVKIGGQIKAEMNFWIKFSLSWHFWIKAKMNFCIGENYTKKTRDFALLHHSIYIPTFYSSDSREVRSGRRAVLSCWIQVYLLNHSKALEARHFSFRNIDEILKYS